MYLEKINSPQDLRAYGERELEILCHEVRENIVQVTKENGGHLASNLGTVELSVALLKVFDSSEDRIIYDVGHQCYTHKLLTSRREQFSTLRKKDGVAGFPKTKESSHDAFNTGHSATSISAGYGMAVSRDAQKKNNKIISVIGDASISTGLAFEALNGLCEYQGQFLLVLNDNGMSISKNRGGLAKILANGKAKEYFNMLGVKYVGCIDGHNIKDLTTALNSVKDEKTPVLLHVKTTKGKGYGDAEKSPEYFHGVAKDFAKNTKDFSNVAGEKLLEIAKKNDKIVAISASMIDGVGLSKFASELPERMFDVGICESHAVTFSAGLCAGGLKPYFAVYSSFLQRGFDNVYHDVALQNLPVTFLIDRCGIVGSDGETHQGVLDLNFLLSCGNIDIACPKDNEELECAIEYSQDSTKPLVVRYPRGFSHDFSAFPKTKFEYGKWEYLKTENTNIIVIACGATSVENAVKASEKTAVKFSVINARWARPMDENILADINAQNIIVLSDSNENGGFASVVASYYQKNNINKNIIQMEIPCVLESGTVAEQQEIAKISVADIVKKVESL